ncbi:NADPH-dependent curcumin reductase CurA [Rhizobium ruizarguesonis]
MISCGIAKMSLMFWRMPPMLIGLLEGRNFGKLIIRVAGGHP